MRVKAPIIEVSSTEATALNKILDRVFPIAPLHAETEKQRDFTYYLIAYVSREGTSYYLNLGVKREDKL